MVVSSAFNERLRSEDFIHDIIEKLKAPVKTLIDASMDE